MSKGTVQQPARTKRSCCLALLTVSAVLVVVTLVLWQIAFLKLGVWKTRLTPVEWQALMKSHPYERDPSYIRSPCPMLNTLANHGFLSRDGQNIHRDELFEAMSLMGLQPIVSVFFIPFAYTLYHKVLPTDHFLDVLKPAKTINLDQLAIHGLLEHDVSLTRRDIHLAPHDWVHPDKDLVLRMVRMAQQTNTSFFGMQQENDYRRIRWIESARENRLNMLGLPFQFSSATECTLLLEIIGRDGALRADHLESILLEERFPEDWFPRERLQPLHRTVRSVYRCWTGLRRSTATPESLESSAAPSI